MAKPLLVRYHEPRQGARIGLRQGDMVSDVTAQAGSVARWLDSSVGRVEAAISDLQLAATSATQYPARRFDNPPAPDVPHWLAPVDSQDVWAAGVTYERSRSARQEEARDGGDIYARVYSAARPELFWKAHGAWVVGPWGEVGIRHDAGWNVPEAELTLVMNPAMQVVGVTAGNDMSSRDIEGENPLYLPQAKVYTASCALGPGIALGLVTDWPAVTIRLTVKRRGQTVVEGSTDTGKIRRRVDELVRYMARCLKYPDGVLLMTGTGIVPASDFTLAAGDEVTVSIDEIGSLTNTVKVV